MSPILGIYASSMQPALNATSYESIATVTVGAGGSSSITFSSIPSTYKHLQIRYLARTARTDLEEDLYLQMNDDTGTNYNWHYLYGTGAAASSGASTTTTKLIIPTVSSANATASIFGAGVIDILDYADTNKYKTIRSLGGNDRNGAGSIAFESGAWRNTNAITKLVFKTDTGANFVQYSSFALFGIKGA